MEIRGNPLIKKDINKRFVGDIFELCNKNLLDKRPIGDFSRFRIIPSIPLNIVKYTRSKQCLNKIIYFYEKVLMGMAYLHGNHRPR
jgi:hypothetical protein